MTGIKPRSADQIADADALYRLVVAYSRAIDRRDFALLRSLYLPDATDSHGAMFDGGIDGYVSFVQGALHHWDTTIHHVVHTDFDIAGDAAEGEVHKLNWHAAPDGTGIITASRSHDIYARRDGAWHFRSRGVVIDWAESRAPDPAAGDHWAARSPRGKPGPTDPLYSILRGFPRHTQGETT